MTSQTHRSAGVERENSHEDSYTLGNLTDNATCHRTLAAQDWSADSEGIQRLYGQRFSRSKPIENVMMGECASCWLKISSDKQEHTLIRALTEEWDKLPQQLLDNVVQSMV
ncbi:hypothetical protein TNCV_3567071 [Trichonephila clavipes]|nr:hypothetical protein TNCV_3567071 [Trichonephila clavipes]